ncbi:MAG: thiosulfate oxidation carrier complex protein SoxZ [Alphaproteobacteria bacterium]|nr:thiosulfate oxidation carrier complex protein SoxZ [Alphaproteobacteria bacterium]
MKVLVSVPAVVRRGEAFEVKAMAMHVMENGFRRDMDGKAVPRKILNHFTCRYNGEIVLDCDWHTPISANPYMSFAVKAVDSGTLTFEWIDDDGSIERHSAPITVT